MRVFIAGDSTAADYPSGQAPQAGWGQALAALLDVPVVNAAYPGASARSSVERLGMHDRVMAEIGPGDVLLICFGHNDGRHDQGRFGAPYGAYTAFLLRYIEGARSRGARPVLVTSVERRTPDGSLTHGTYPAAMKALAARERVPLVDLQAASARRWRELGADATRELFLWLGPHPNYPRGSADDTHFTAAGAIEAARLLLAEAGPLLPPAARTPADLTWRSPMPVRSIDARSGRLRAEYAAATPQEAGAACRRAADLLPVLDEAGPRGRAALLEAMADALTARTPALVAAADAETALGEAGLTAAAARAAERFRLLAEVLREGSFLDARIDSATHADVRSMNVPRGVAAVFTPPDAPLASGDTADALAAGCTVVVKAHELHPETAALTFGALRAGAAAAGFPEDVVQLVHGPDAGTALRRDGRVKAVADRGSPPGGLDPLLVTPGAAKARRPEIAAVWSRTAPRLVFAPAGAGLPEAIAAHIADLAPQPLPGDAARTAFDRAVAARAAIDGLRTVVAARLMAGPASLLGASDVLLDDYHGPLTVVLEYTGEEELADALAAVQSAPTITLYSEPHETDLAARLAALARDRTSHLAFDSAPNPPDAAALGRFLRPVTYENCPPRLLPPALRDDNPWRLPRRHDGTLVLPAT
ncbi:aldehyde dehydrogenase family protein [Actinomadura geliboluensis]